jgi:hypothetical protein
VSIIVIHDTYRSVHHGQCRLQSGKLSIRKGGDLHTGQDVFALHGLLHHVCDCEVSEKENTLLVKRPVPVYVNKVKSPDLVQGK